MESDTDVVVAHDQMWDYGGAERVALHIGKALDAPVYTPFAGEEARSAADALGVELVAFAQDKYSGLGTWRRKEGFKSFNLQLDWQTATLAEFDLIFSAHMFSRHYRTLDHQYMINYCHSPPRWLNDLQKYRMESLPRGTKRLAQYYITAMDVLDSRSADRVDAFIANSEVIRERIRRYYRRDATVIYPPIDTAGIEPSESTGDYYLMVGRIVRAKRPETVVKAFEDLGKPLKIAGSPANEPAIGAGTMDRVRSLAGSNVELLGFVPDEKKVELLQNAKAVVYVPVREDFGMVPIEALAAGTPVIAADEGFPRLAIDDGVSGAVVEPTVEGVKGGVNRIENSSFDPDALASIAEEYSTERFYEQINRAVETFTENATRYRLHDDDLLEAE
jgi:glycosyltransferase involved in cell wall biosynthesis